MRLYCRSLYIDGSCSSFAFVYQYFGCVLLFTKTTAAVYHQKIGTSFTFVVCVMFAIECE